MPDGYEMVVGLEVHVELATQTKIFCGCPTTFGAAPNTQCCPVCAGLPGALPVLNRQAVMYAIRAGLATSCAIAPYSKFDRKHYFYPDLPKAYQISQFEPPLCQNGWLDIETEAGPKRIGITRIHLEEDAGKLVHHPEKGTLIDLNRCGVPLVEIVSKPELHSAEEAVAYLKKLRAVLLYTGITDAKMNEGSLRCDVNLSVRKKGSAALGTRTEVKNLNSFGFVARAIRHEFARQVAELEAGRPVLQQTRRFDAASGQTIAMRTKANAEDYRYLPEPDLPPIITTKAQVKAIGAAIPPLPDARKAAYMRQYGLLAYHAEQLVLERQWADFFEAAAAQSRYPRQVAALLLGEVFRLAEAHGGSIAITPQQLAGVAGLVGEGRVNSGGAKKLLGALWAHGGQPEELMRTLDLEQLSNPAALAAIVNTVLAQNTAAVADWQSGKTKAFKALMGQAMAETRGRADPVLLKKLLEEGLAGLCTP